MKIFRIHDIKADAYLPVFPAESTGSAIRTFSELANGTDIVGRHPEDFVLYEVGFYEVTSPEITPINPKSLTTASDLVDA